MIARGMLAVIIMIICLTGSGLADQQTTVEGSPAPLAKAEAFIKEGKFSDAKSLLLSMVAGMPSDWKPVNIKGDSIHIAYWDTGRFIACSTKDRERLGGKSVRQAIPSYSKAYYLLAYISIESKNVTEAKKYIDKAMELEPDHPLLLNEKGLILQKMGAHAEAVKCFSAVTSSTGCVTDYERSRALRGQGISLIDLGRLDEAEQALRQSLIIAPNNKTAIDELEYIRRIRSGSSPNAPIKIVPGQQK